MAILIYFRKTSDNADEVEYAFGSAPDGLPRRLAIDEHRRTVRPVDGDEDTQYSHAASKIFGIERKTGAWPDRGMRAS